MYLTMEHVLDDGARGFSRASVANEAGGPRTQRLRSVSYRRYRCRIVGIKYSWNARSKSYVGAKPQSARAAESSTSAGHESTMPCRFGSTLNPIDACGNAATTTSRIADAERLNALRLYVVRVSRLRGADARASSASTASGIAMNGIVV